MSCDRCKWVDNLMALLKANGAPDNMFYIDPARAVENERLRTVLEGVQKDATWASDVRVQAEYYLHMAKL